MKGAGEHEPIMTRKAIGQIMKARREEDNKTQYEVSQTLGYRHENFLSMVESGRTNIPMLRTMDFITEYNMPPIFALVILKATFPDAYGFFVNLVSEAGKVVVGKKPEEIDAAVLEVFRMQSEKYRLEPETKAEPAPSRPKGKAAQGRTRSDKGKK